MSRISRLLNTSVEVWRATLTDDAYGGQAETWNQVATYRARFSQPWARDRQAADQHSALLTHVVYLPDTATVQQGDELRQEGRVFDVIAVLQPSESGTYLRADCQARQPVTGGP